MNRSANFKVFSLSIWTVLSSKEVMLVKFFRDHHKFISHADHNDRANSSNTPDFHSIDVKIGVRDDDANYLLF